MGCFAFEVGSVVDELDHDEAVAVVLAEEYLFTLCQLYGLSDLNLLVGVLIP